MEENVTNYQAQITVTIVGMFVAMKFLDMESIRLPLNGMQ